MSRRFYVLKIVTIMLGGLYLPIAIYIGLNWEDEPFKALFALGLSIVLSLVDGLIYWNMLETLNRSKRSVRMVK